MRKHNDLGTDVGLIIGHRDAVHVPVVIGKFKRNPDLKFLLEEMEGLKPGRWVKFVDNRYVDFVLSDEENGHGIIDPFYTEISFYDPIRILIRPGMTTPVRHEYEINPELLKVERQLLNQELEAAREEDPECADCWAIKNGRVYRN